MKKIKIRSLLVGLFIGLFSILNTGSVSAAGNAIAVSPMYQNVVLVPGETYRGGFTIVNPQDSTSDLNYLVTVGAYTPTKTSDDDYDYSGADFATRTNMNRIVDWISLDNPEGTIEPGEDMYVTFSIKVPKDAPAGGQYASLLARENPEYAQQDDSVAIRETMQIAHILYADVAGETDRSAEILENKVPSFLFDNKFEATSMVRNNGNVHTSAKYVLQVWPLGSDEEICTNEEDESSGFVMPDTEKYHVESCELPIVGVFKAKHTVKIFNEVSEVEKMVIVCPLWLLLIIIIAIVAIIVWLVVRAKGRKR